MTGVGSCAVTANQVGDSETAAAEASQSVEAGKRSQSITLDALPAMVFGQAPVTVSASSSVGLTVGLTAAGACELTDGALVAVAAGECSVTATQAGDEVTTAAEAVVRTAVVAKRTQTIAMPTLPALVFGLDATPISATSNLGLPVTITGEGGCRVFDGVLTIVGIDDCTLTAVAAGDAVTSAATAVLTADVMGIPSSVLADMQASLGSRSVGAAVSATGSGLLPGSTLLLTVRDADQPLGSVLVLSGDTELAMGVLPDLAAGSHEGLGSATVRADGGAVVLGALPDLGAGSYQLVAVGTALDTSRAEFALGFTIDAGGRLVAIGDSSLPVDPPVGPPGSTTDSEAGPRTSGSADVLAATGADAGSIAAAAVFSILLGLVLVVGRRRPSDA